MLLQSQSTHLFYSAFQTLLGQRINTRYHFMDCYCSLDTCFFINSKRRIHLQTHVTGKKFIICLSTKLM